MRGEFRALWVAEGRVRVREFRFEQRGKTHASGVLGFSFACGRRPHAKLNRRTERGVRTVVANMNIWIADSDIEGPPVRALGPGPAHEETLPWAWAHPGPWPFRVPGPRVH